MAPVGNDQGLRCENITVAFDRIRALSSCSLSFPPAGIVGLMGPNGSGKTTLFNVFSGFVRPAAGCCHFEGHDITRLEPYQIVRLGISRSFQELRLIRGISVLENVLLARDDHNEQLLSALSRRDRLECALNKERAVEILSSLGLGAESLKSARSLSFGQQKVLALACCIATNSRVLLLDEPFAGVAPATLDHMYRVLDELRRKDRLIVIIEHDLPAVQRIASDVIVMSAGSILWEGPVSRVLNETRVIDAYFS
jgi:ABC-type branched-subunit amino acid transport system ATPase component